jgi:prepilin-type N-terminal cleavage/methylation domain-containing protein
MSGRNKRAFTLVELLVVIGIIALLIAILMPALSRARKQALQASCGSNARQLTYGALAYANDWKEQLPTRFNKFAGDPGTRLTDLSRLPLIGFDTCTIWDWGTYESPYLTSPGYGFNWLGGFAFLMRDYMKNDWDVAVCPDGFYTKESFLQKWPGPVAYNYYCPYLVIGMYGSPNEGQIGYIWLPHRPVSGSSTAATNCSSTPTPMQVSDTPGEISKTASDLPSLLVSVDWNHFGGRYYDGCGVGSCGGGQGGCGVLANHPATSYRGLIRGGSGTLDSGCLRPVYPPNIGRMENPFEMPLGQNRSRIDARTEWKPWQDWKYFAYSRYNGGSASCADATWYSF